MGIITRIEDKLGNIVEKPFGGKNVFDPLSVEISLRRLIERKKRDILGKVAIPGSFTIIVDREIYREYEPFFDAIRASLLKSLAAWTKEKNYESFGSFEINFRKDSLKKHPYAITASFKQISPAPIASPPLYPQKDEKCPREKHSKSVAGELISKAGERFIIYAGESIIGRGMDCRVRLDDPTVSEKHARIFFRHGKVILEDFGSRNGSRVNQIRIKKNILKDGDRVTFGSTEMIFRDSQGGRQEPVC